MTRAYAKLNLALSVGAPIDAPATPHHGYHPICSYMHAIDLYDQISIQRLANDQPSDFQIVWLGQDGTTNAVQWDLASDLVVRAHAALEAHCGRRLACAVRVLKSIPAGGGLGGGSSDAAAVLIGLDRVFGLGLGVDGLLPVAMGLGSDIGYFLDDASPPRPARVSGVGESIQRLNTTHRGSVVTLILPGFGCSTGAVYTAFDAVGPGRVDAGSVDGLIGAESLTDALMHNDLARAACGVAPELGVLIERIGARLGRAVHVTGSGSTLFVLGPIEQGALCEVAPDCRVLCTRLV